MERAGHVYSRISNPTVAVLEERIAALEGGVGAIATASGQAALHLAIATLMGAGAHIVASARSMAARTTCSATRCPLRHRDDVRQSARYRRVARAIRAATRVCCSAKRSAIRASTCSTSPPSRQIAHEQSVPLLVDATFTTPYLMKPFEHGADLLYHSATKFLGGHGIAIGGVLVDCGALRLGGVGQVRRHSPSLTPASTAWISRRSRARAPSCCARAREGLRDFGACMAPMTAFQILQGIETLHLRMPRHVENTRKVVEFLAGHAAVEKVMYPELPMHPDHALAKRLLPHGAGAVFRSI